MSVRVQYVPLIEGAPPIIGHSMAYVCLVPFGPKEMKLLLKHRCLPAHAACPQFYHEQAFKHLEELFVQADAQKDGILSFQQFQQLAGERGAC